MGRDDTLSNIIQRLIWTTEEDFNSVTSEVTLLIEKFRGLVRNLEKLDKLIKIKYALKSKVDHMEKNNLLQEITTLLENGISVMLYAPPGFQKSEILKEVYKKIGEKNATFANSPDSLSDKRSILIVDNAQDFFLDLEKFIKKSKNPPIILFATNYILPANLRYALGDGLKVFDKHDLQCSENLFNLMADVMFYPEDRICWPAIQRLMDQVNREKKEGLSEKIFEVTYDFIEDVVLPHVKKRLKNDLVEKGLCILSLLNGYGFPYKNGGFRKEWVDECLGNKKSECLLTELENLALLEKTSEGTYSLPLEIRMYFRNRSNMTEDYYPNVINTLEHLGEPATILVHDFMGEWEKTIDAMNRFIHPLALFFGPFNRYSHQRKLIRGILGYQITENGREQVSGFRSINYLLNVDNLEHPYDFYIKRLTHDQRLLYAKLLYTKILFEDKDAEKCFKMLFEDWKEEAIKKTLLSRYLKQHYEILKILYFMIREKYEDALEKNNLLLKCELPAVERAALHLLKIETLYRSKKKDMANEAVKTLFEEIEWAEEYLRTDVLMIEFRYRRKRKLNVQKEPFFERYMLEFIKGIESDRISPDDDNLYFTISPETDDIQDDFYTKNYTGVLHVDNGKGIIIFPDGKMVHLTKNETDIISKYVKSAKDKTHVCSDEYCKKALQRLREKLEKYGIQIKYNSYINRYYIISIVPDIIQEGN